MTRVEEEIAVIASEAGLVLDRSQRDYRLKSWEGLSIGPFRSARECRVWLAGYINGQAAHRPDCDCGRLACTFRQLAQETRP